MKNRTNEERESVLSWSFGTLFFGGGSGPPFVFGGGAFNKVFSCFWITTKKYTKKREKNFGVVFFISLKNTSVSRVCVLPGGRRRRQEEEEEEEEEEENEMAKDAEKTTAASSGASVQKAADAIKDKVDQTAEKVSEKISEQVSKSEETSAKGMRGMFGKLREKLSLKRKSSTSSASASLTEAHARPQIPICGSGNKRRRE